METAGNIIRRSIYIFLQNYQHFSTISALLAFPFSVSILLSQALIPSASLFPTVYNRLQNLFNSAGFPPSSEFFSILNLKLSQTISSSFFTLPFIFTFFLFSKASVIQALNHHKLPTSPPSFSSFVSIFNPLLLTYICNSILIISANATAFCLLFLSFNILEGFDFSSRNSFLLLSAVGVVVYSVLLGNALVIGNLSLVLSGTERSGGYQAILNACVMIRGRASTALALALPVNLSMAGIEALFQYRIVRVSHRGQTPTSLMALEGILIAYLYSIFVVLDTIATVIFFKSCKASSCTDQEGRYAYRVEIAEEDNAGYVSLKVSQELP